MAQVKTLLSNKNSYPGSHGVAVVFWKYEKKKRKIYNPEKRQVLAQHCRSFQTQHAQEQKIRWETSEHTKVE